MDVGRRATNDIIFFLLTEQEGEKIVGKYNVCN